MYQDQVLLSINYPHFIKDEIHRRHWNLNMYPLCHAECYSRNLTAGKKLIGWFDGVSEFLTVLNWISSVT